MGGRHSRGSVEGSVAGTKVKSALRARFVGSVLLGDSSEGVLSIPIQSFLLTSITNGHYEFPDKVSG